MHMMYSDLSPREQWTAALKHPGTICMRFSAIEHQRVVSDQVQPHNKRVYVKFAFSKAFSFTIRQK